MRGTGRFRDEGGAAVVTAILISMAVLALSLVAVGLSIHNLNSSSYDRKRLQAIDVAESGIDLFSSVLGSSTFSSVPCPTHPGATGDPGANIFGDLATIPGAHYAVYVNFYSTWPPTSTSGLTCTQVQNGSIPGAALVKSVGTAVKPETGIPVTRTMESLVRVTPTFGAAGEAVFSDTGLSFQNQLTLNGNAGNNGDVYTNGNFTLANNTVIGGSVRAQGSATISQGVVKADVWSGGNVSLSSGISVFGNAIAAGLYNVGGQTAGTMTLNNSTVYGDAKAKGTITLSNNAVVKGTKTSGAAGLTAPPHESLPLFCWPQCPGDPDNATRDYYESTDVNKNPTGIIYQERSYSGTGTTPCASAKSAIDSWFGASSGNYVVVINGSCPLQWANGSTVTVKGNLAIFSFGGGASCGQNANIHGAICTVNNVTFNSSGGTWNVLFVRPYVSGLVCSTGDYDVTVSNSTVFNGLKIFIYSQCTVNFGNNNASGVNTQLIGGTVNLTNQMVLNFDPTLAPGFRLTGYKLGSAYLREIANGT